MVSFFRWVCDNEPDCGSAPSGKMDVSDEDPARCRGNVTCEGNHFLCKVSIEFILVLRKELNPKDEFPSKIVLSTDYRRPMKPFFNDISNFWARIDKLD